MAAWVAPLVAGAASGLASGLMGNQSVDKANEAQRKMFEQQMAMLRDIYSRENIYSPGQINMQDALFPMWSAYVSQALGSPVMGLAPAEIKESDLTPKLSGRDIVNLQHQAASLFPDTSQGYMPDPKIAKQREDWVQGEIAKREAEREAERGALTRKYEKEQNKQVEEGRQMYEAFQKNAAAQIEAERGAGQSAMDIAKQNAVTELMGRNRQMMGSGSSGHVMGQIGDLEQQYLKQRPQLDVNAQRSMWDWQTQAAKEGMGQLQNMAYGQGAGNQPFVPPTPASPLINMTLPNMTNQFANLLSMYTMNKYNNNNPSTSNYGMFGYPTSMTG